MPALPDIALCVAAIAFAAMGLGALAAPDRVTSQFDIPPLNANGRNEVRAVYGGFGLAMAAMVLTATLHPVLRSGICATLAAALGGMAAGRLISAIMDRKLGRAPALYLVIETGGVTLLLYAA